MGGVACNVCMFRLLRVPYHGNEVIWGAIPWNERPCNDRERKMIEGQTDRGMRVR